MAMELFWASSAANPFYKKGGGSLYLSSLISSFFNTIRLGLPFLLLYIFGFFAPGTIRLTIGLLWPIIGFASAFILLSDEMNFGARFQYVLLPIILMSWWPLARHALMTFSIFLQQQNDRRTRTAWAIFILAVCITIMAYQYKVGDATYYQDGRFTLALKLKNYKDEGFVLATTESGLLPLYSEWKALDAWGLNDPWIAHHGKITYEYLAQFKPHLIVWHEYFSPLVPPNGKGKWFEMVMPLKAYAENNNYILAAVFGETPYDTHYYYVRSDFPKSAEIIQEVRQIDYYWWNTGKKAINYAMLRY